MNSLRKHEFITAVVLLLILLTYVGLVWPALSGPFVFDDFPNLQNLALLGNDVSDNLGRYLASFIGSPGRPISALSFLINDSAWPSEPFSFKYTNLMIHLLNGVLLFGLLRQLAKANPTLPQSPFWPLLAMAAWLFHPLQLSAQMLVVQRMTLLSATFCFIGLWGYIAQLQRARSAWSAFAALSVLGTCTILAFLSKENGALLPLFAWVLNATLLRELLAGKPLAVRRFIQWACILPSLAVFAAMLFMATRPGAFTSREFSMVERLMTQMHVIADYLRHIVIPRLSGSGIYFDDYPITRSWTQPISTLLLATGYLTSLIFAISKRQQYPTLSFGILWFFAGHAMESSILDLELFFEHRNYLPLLGIVLILSAWTLQSRLHPQLSLGLFSSWLLMLSIISALQAPVWGNAALMTKLWKQERPMSLRATQELAKYQYDHGMRQDAIDTLLSSYRSGIKYIDLPLSALIAKCWSPEIKAPSNLYQTALAEASTSRFSNSALQSTLILRQATQENVCNKTLTSDQWLSITDALLKNENFRLTSESHIRVERAKLFTHRRDFNLTMIEYEAAYKARPSVELSQKIAEILFSAGLIEDGLTWLEKGTHINQPILDSIFYNPKKHSLLAIKKIRDSSKEQK